MSTTFRPQVCELEQREVPGLLDFMPVLAANIGTGNQNVFANAGIVAGDVIQIGEIDLNVIVLRNVGNNYGPHHNFLGTLNHIDEFFSLFTHL